MDTVNIEQYITEKFGVVKWQTMWWSVFMNEVYNVFVCVGVSASVCTCVCVCQLISISYDRVELQ